MTVLTYIIKGLDSDKFPARVGFLLCNDSWVESPRPGEPGDSLPVCCYGDLQEHNLFDSIFDLEHLKKHMRNI